MAAMLLSPAVPLRTLWCGRTRWGRSRSWLHSATATVCLWCPLALAQASRVALMLCRYRPPYPCPFPAQGCLCNRAQPLRRPMAGWCLL